jgi:adenylate cyclase
MSASLKVLVVDDEPDLAPLIRQKFRRQIREGLLEFTIAGDGLEALEKLEETPEIDIILTDINMPRMDGLTFLSKLGDIGGLRKAVVVTAYGDMENIRIAMNRGAFDFLTKPIDLDDLEITIGKASEVVQRERNAVLVRETFGRYLSDNVVSTLLADPEGIKLGGEKRVVTIMMSDLRGFSMISERLAPEKVVDILNIYLGRMAEVITEFGGTIDEFIGDGILSVFGAPVHNDDDARRAVACAVAMQLAMDDVNEELIASGFSPLEMGIGINTGEVVVGNIGSQVRTKYGVVGSHVNLTSRIESFTVGGQVLVSERTLEDAGPGIDVSKSFKVRMKGFEDPVPVYEVNGVPAPFGLTLPSRDLVLTDLSSPLPVAYWVLDGKHVGDEFHRAELIAVAEKGAMFETNDSLDALENIRFRFENLDHGSGEQHDVYGKVTDDEAGDNRYVVRFTGIPDEIATALARLIEMEEA